MAAIRKSLLSKANVVIYIVLVPKAGKECYFLGQVIGYPISDHRSSIRVKTAKETFDLDCLHLAEEYLWRRIYVDLGVGAPSLKSNDPVVFLHGKIYSPDYLSLLSHQIHSTVAELFPEGNAVFQNDNLQIHTAGAFTE